MCPLRFRPAGLGGERATHAPSPGSSEGPGSRPLAPAACSNVSVLAWGLHEARPQPSCP